MLGRQTELAICLGRIGDDRLARVLGAVGLRHGFGLEFFDEISIHLEGLDLVVLELLDPLLEEDLGALFIT